MTPVESKADDAGAAFCGWAPEADAEGDVFGCPWR